MASHAFLAEALCENAIFELPGQTFRTVRNAIFGPAPRRGATFCSHGRPRGRVFSNSSNGFFARSLGGNPIFELQHRLAFIILKGTGAGGVYARGLRLPTNRLSIRRKPSQPCTGPHAPNGTGPCVRMRDSPCDCTRAAISRVADFGRTFILPQYVCMHNG